MSNFDQKNGQGILAKLHVYVVIYVAKYPFDKICVTYTYFSRSPSFKGCKKSLFRAVSYEPVDGFSPNVHRYIVWRGE